MSNEVIIATKNIGSQARASLVCDQDPLDPREPGTTITTIVAWHRRYHMSDTTQYPRPEDFREQVLEPMARNAGRKKPKAVEVYENESGGEIRDLMQASRRNPGVLMPLYMYDHSGLVLSTSPFSCPWDSGQLGWIYVTSRQARQHRLSTGRQEEIINRELNVLQDYHNGEVYELRIERPGQPEERMGDLLTEESGYPDQAFADSMLSQMDLSPREQLAAAASPWIWE